MVLPSTFHERLEQMEQTRNERLVFLQTEKDLQIQKSKVLASKISNTRSMEQRCLKLDHKIASQQSIISSLKFEIDSLNTKYLENLDRLRSLKSEVADLEELEKEKQKYFSSRTREMEEFRAEVEHFTAERRMQVEELQNRVKELRSTFTELKDNISYSDNSKIAAAEMRKSELLAEKQNLDEQLTSNYKIREQLQKQLRSILMTQMVRKERNPSEVFQDKQQK